MTTNTQTDQLSPNRPAPERISSRTLRPPPLETGDHLTRAEFERRYRAMRHVKKAELIEGIVYMASPLHFLTHSEPHAHIIAWLGVYRATTPGVRLGDNATVRLDLDNEVQPDALLRIDHPRLRSSLIDEDDYVQGPPELVVEIAGTTATHDLRNKLNVYRRNGVREYIAWQVYDQTITWFHLRDEVYTPLPLDEQGVMRSIVFPGLWLSAPAMLAGDLATVLATVQSGLQSAEHAEFVALLQGE
jgi:Uma2 family endonuclease